MANPPLFLKTATTAWIYNGGIAVSITSLNSTIGSLYAYATAIAHGSTNGDLLAIAGASPASYNGAVVAIILNQTIIISVNTIISPSNNFNMGQVTINPGVTVTVPVGQVWTIMPAGGADNFAYLMSTAAASSPATGTITTTKALQQITDVNYPALTVPGVVQLDGAYYVMDASGTIYGSTLGTPWVWNPLNYIQAQVEVDNGVALAKYLNYLLAFGTWSTEVFYDASLAAPASPLQRVDNAYMNLGCASARSIALCENSVVWMAQVKEGTFGASAGRSIVLMSGFQTQKISTSAIERILNADDLASVRSMAFKDGGHSFYVLTLGTSNLTVAYDFSSGLWYQWTSMTAQSTQSVAGITLSSGFAQNTAIVHQVGHGFNDGDVVNITGATQTEYNISPNISYIDADHYSYPVTGTPVTPATGTILAQGYTEGHWRMAMHTSGSGQNYFLDESSGYLYTLSQSNMTDHGGYINFLIRTTNLDSGSNVDKKIEKLELIGDKVAGNALVRYSKNDYASYSSYRPVSLSIGRSMIKRVGRARRAAIAIRVTDSIKVRLERMDITFEDGSQ